MTPAPPAPAAAPAERPPASPQGRQARVLVDGLQSRFAARLEAVAARRGDPAPLAPVRWLRDGGRHGGGMRRGVADSPTFDRASLNVSGVHYDDLPDKRLSSATALSCIVHPAHPRAPSMHMHLSWTELRDGSGYWRLMADLNPCLPDPAQTARFSAVLDAAAGPHAPRGRAQGDRYFSIPALGRTRGVAHFYLEGHNTGDWAADAALVEAFGDAVINVYCDILDETPTSPPTAEERAAQRAYHTLYLFQVLTLDRGTTSGLLVHDQNDVGILGSLPSTVDPALLAQWRAQVPAPQERLVDALIAVLGTTGPATVDVAAKRALAAAVRGFYRAHPEALALQARGDVLPPTVANHR